MFISIKLTETTKTGIDKTKKIHKKSRRFKMYVNDSHHLHKHCTQTTTICPPECVPDQRQRRCCRHDMQFAVCHFLISRNRIKFIDLLNYGNSSFVLKFRNKFMVAVTFFFTQTFNEMFIFVGECRDFTDANITSPGKGCQ